jgi:hypothetical protein
VVAEAIPVTTITANMICFNISGPFLMCF